MAKKDWTKMVSDIVSRGEPWDFHLFQDFLREEASDDDRRDIVKEVERRIKAIANDKEGRERYYFRHFGMEEAETLQIYLGIRKDTLNEMMHHPTHEETVRMGQQNDQLLRLTDECYERCRDMWLALLESAHEVDNRSRYLVRGELRFVFNDSHSVVEMANDDYYGSDFKYMIRLMYKLLKQSGDAASNILAGTSFDFYHDRERLDFLFSNELDDGHSWKECDRHLQNPAFDRYRICYAMGLLCLRHSLPDVLRMDDFVVTALLQYRDSAYDQRQTASCPHDPHWPHPTGPTSD